MFINGVESVKKKSVRLFGFDPSYTWLHGIHKGENKKKQLETIKEKNWEIKIKTKIKNELKTEIKGKEIKEIHELKGDRYQLKKNGLKNKWEKLEKRRRNWE